MSTTITVTESPQVLYLRSPIERVRPLVEEILSRQLQPADRRAIEMWLKRFKNTTEQIAWLLTDLRAMGIDGTALKALLQELLPAQSVDRFILSARLKRIGYDNLLEHEITAERIALLISDLRTQSLEESLDFAEQEEALLSLIRDLLPEGASVEEFIITARLKAIIASPLFPSLIQRRLQRWVAQFSANMGRPERDVTAIELSLFLIDYVYPLVTRNPQEAARIESQLKELLSRFLPANASVERFIQENEVFAAEELELRMKQIAEQIAVQGANAFSQGMQQNYNALRRRVHELNGRRREQFVELNERLRQLSEKLVELDRLLKASVDQFNTISNQRGENHKQYLETLKECQDVLTSLHI